MPNHIAIVFSPDYSRELQKLAFTTPVWLVDTPENRAAAEEAWHAAVEWPHITVTLFRPPEEHVTKEEWQTLLEQVSFRERALDSVDVVGTPLSIVARAALMEAGLARFEETATGFRAKRA